MDVDGREEMTNREVAEYICRRHMLLADRGWHGLVKDIEIVLDEKDRETARALEDRVKL